MGGGTSPGCGPGLGDSSSFPRHFSQDATWYFLLPLSESVCLVFIVDVKPAGPWGLAPLFWAKTAICMSVFSKEVVGVMGGRRKQLEVLGRKEKERIASCFSCSHQICRQPPSSGMVGTSRTLGSWFSFFHDSKHCLSPTEPGFPPCRNSPLSPSCPLCDHAQFF